MKLHTERAVVERGGVHAEREFTIKTTAKAFDILSSGLYSDKYLAIVRELSCNAYDSHVDNGNPETPFEIHLPNTLEPYFSVKDFGTGLSEEDVMSLYTTYFESTKTNSNDYIGALGLGSKSPFSYTQMFEVISRWNGKRLLFAVFINEDGVPTIAKQGEGETDEVNGLEVKFTVKKEDFYNFKNRTESALMYFPVKPNVVGADHFRFDSVPHERRFEGDGWYVAEEGWRGNRFCAVQGNVPYRVNMDQIREHLTDDEEAFFSAAHITAFFEIGDLEVAASREEIRYDDRSKQALVTMARQIRADLTGIIEARCADLPTTSFWDACIALDALSNEMFGTSSALRRFVQMDKVTNKILKRYVEQHGNVTMETETYVWHEVSYYTPPRYSSSSQRLVKQGIGDAVTPQDRIRVVLMDMRTGGISKTAAWVEEQPGVKNVISIRPLKEPRLTPDRVEKKDDGSLEYLPPKITAANELRKIRRHLGNPTVQAASKMKCTMPARTYTRTTGSMFIFDGENTGYNGRSRYNPKPQWKKLDLDETTLAEGGLYFVMRNGARIIAPVEGKEKHMEWSAREVKSYFEKIVNLLNKQNGTEYTIYDIKGISKLHAKKVVGDPNWINIFDATRELVPQYQDAIIHQARLQETPEVLGLTGLLSSELFIEKVRELDSISPFRLKVEPMFTAHEGFSGLNGSAAFLKAVDRKWGAKLFVDVDAEGYFGEGDFNEMYPMLQFVGEIRTRTGGYSYSTPTDLDALFDYIRMCDAQADN